jgi:hypothetical protein
VTTSGGTPVPYTAGGITANHYQSYEVDVSTSSHTTGVGPNDGATHLLVSATLWVTLTSGTITGVAVAQTALTDTSGGTPGILNAQVFATGLPSAGQLPFDKVELAWAGGIAIPVEAVTTSQLQVVTTVSGYGGGTISSFNAQAYVALSWT